MAFSTKNGIESVFDQNWFEVFLMIYRCIYQYAPINHWNVFTVELCHVDNRPEIYLAFIRSAIQLMADWIINDQTVND